MSSCEMESMVLLLVVLSNTILLRWIIHIEVVLYKLISNSSLISSHDIDFATVEYVSGTYKYFK